LNAESELGNNPIDDLLFEGVQSKDIEERLAWHTNAPLLYDIFLGCTLEWPALSISWLPDEPNENCRLVFGSHTDGSASNEVVIAELGCAADRTIDANPWRQWQLDGLGDTEGFGCSAADGSSPLCAVVRLNHPTEVNRVAPCPHRGQLIATKAATGDVHLFNYKAERSETDFSPDVTLHSPGGNVDGFALCWCPLEKSSLASGSNDGRLCIWDVEASTLSAKGSRSPVNNFTVEGAVCDVSFSRFQPSVLCSVGDNKKLSLWDIRAGSKSQAPRRCVQVSDDEVLSVDWSYHNEHWLATTGKDRKVHVWDSRFFEKPLHSLNGHHADAVCVRWAPFREKLLGSCSADSRLILWDLEPKEGLPEPDDEPGDDEDDKAPELLFAHGGHTMGVSDFSWNSVDDYLICSVAEDNELEIWKASSVFYLADSDAEEPPLKRARSDVEGDDTANVAG